MSSQTFFEKKPHTETGCHFVSINMVMWSRTCNSSFSQECCLQKDSLFTLTLQNKSTDSINLKHLFSIFKGVPSTICCARDWLHLKNTLAHRGTRSAFIFFMASLNAAATSSATPSSLVTSRLSAGTVRDSESEALHLSADMTVWLSMDPHADFVVMWQEVRLVGSSSAAITWSSTAAPLGKAGTTVTSKDGGLNSGSHNKSCNTDRFYSNYLAGDYTQRRTKHYNQPYMGPPAETHAVLHTH